MNLLQISSYCATAVLGSLLGGNTFAQAVQNNAIYLQYGQATHSANSWALGVTLPWKTGTTPGFRPGHRILGYLGWAMVRRLPGRQSFDLGHRRETHFALACRPGSVPWFAEAGLGVSYAVNHRYLTDQKDFSTRYNFATHIGVGYLFGEQLKSEISLRLEHHSNAGIKHPNPGENFLQIRYARHF